MLDLILKRNSEQIVVEYIQFIIYNDYVDSYDILTIPKFDEKILFMHFLKCISFFLPYLRA